MKLLSYCLRSAFFLLLGLAGSLSLRGAEQANGSAEVLTLDSRRMTALLQADMPALREIFSDDCVYVHSTGKIQSKAEYLELIAMGTLKYASLAYDGEPTIRLFGRDTAVVTGRLRAGVQSKDGVVTARSLAATVVYARRSGHWQMVSYQSTSIPTP